MNMRQTILSGLILTLVLAGVAVPTLAAEAGETSSDEPADGVVAYYFHGDVRCNTCRKLEAYTEEAVRTAFEEALDEGRLSWRVVNIDREENAHFLEDFQLTNKTVVVAEYRAGEIVRYEKLDRVWRLVRNKDKFLRYIQSELSEFLGGA